MGHERGVGCSASETHSPRLLLLLGAVTAALLIHLFGPALQAPTTAAETPAHGHSALEASGAHAAGLDLELSPDEHAGQTCHAVLGFAPATTMLPVATCAVTTWREHRAAEDSSGIRTGWIGGDGGDASVDPRRSPGVQRT